VGCEGQPEKHGEERDDDDVGCGGEVVEIGGGFGCGHG